ncbi:MAG: UvrD-helicase domain-containing protein [Synergistaceae bacterium]|nr:UvrD-helicase domain-containing protein [Synergistaceae bacterium]
MTATEVLADAGARKRIEEDLDCNFVVEAAAGTGKTTSLVGRMLSLVRSGVPLGNIAAVTFTRKAAARLSEALQIRLEQAAAQESDKKAKKLLLQALDTREQAFIGTIHSFCARMLRERPVEAGVTPDFMELDETDAAVMRDRFWRQYADELPKKNPQAWSSLKKIGLDIDSLRPLFGNQTANPDVDVVVDSSLQPPDVQSVSANVFSFLDRMQNSRKHAETAAGNGDKAAVMILFLLDRRAHLNQAALPDVIDFLSRFPGASTITLKNWPDRDAAKGVKQSMVSLKQSIDALLTEWAGYCYSFAVDVTGPAVPLYGEYRRSEGVLDFGDLLLKTRTMLRDNPAVRRYFSARYARLLVDEFQDTDPIQAEIMFLLAGEESSQTDWRSLTPRKGSLFIVGDPKQSIYRFRRADIGTYNFVRDRILATGGELLTLQTNFRSEPAVCEWVNGVFAGKFPDDSTPEQARRVDLFAGKQCGDGPCGVFFLDHPVEGRAVHEEVQKRDAEAIAEWIGNAVNNGFCLDGKPLAWEDYLVLTPFKKETSLYADALEVRGIPCNVTGGEGIGNSEELVFLLPFLRAVSDRGNSGALLAWLRGPLCGIDDETLYRYVKERKWLSFGKDDLPDGTDPKLVRAERLLDESRRLVAVSSPGAALARIADLLGLFLLAGSGKAGERRVGALAKILHLAREKDSEGASFRDIVHWLENGPGQEQGLPLRSGGAVRVMNVHQAKGLEAPVVFLANPVAPKNNAAYSHISRDGESPQGYFLVASGQYNGTKLLRPPHWEEKSKLEERFLEAERDRLQYVAATRAEKLLVVSAMTKKSGRESSWNGLEPFLKHELSELVIHPACVNEPARLEQLFLFGDESDPLFLEDVSRLRDAGRERAERVKALFGEGFEPLSVTALTHRVGGAFPYGEEEGDGMPWGTVLHRLLEMLAADPELDIPVTAGRVGINEGLDSGQIARMTVLVEGIRESAFWNRITASERRLAEVPFLVRTVADSEKEKKGAGATESLLLSGTVDLAILEGDSWTLIDYKTNSARNDAVKLAAYYSPQLSRYVRHWKELTKQETAGLLWFVETGEFFDEKGMRVEG